MLRSLLSTLTGPRLPPPAADGRICAIGDIHGRIDLLIPLVEQLLSRASGPCRIVFLGDYIDRGPESRAVIEFLMHLGARDGIQPVFLLGNHELMLLRFLDDPAGGRRWLSFGEYETLVSYGVGLSGDPDDRAVLAEASAGLAEALGPHRAFIEDLRAMHQSGNLLFTHAGADPDRAPEDQGIEALAWGTPAFATRPRRDGLWVVHGHTIVDEPAIAASRISVDTGAYRTGRLTALVADGPALGFVTETGPEGAPEDW